MNKVITGRERQGEKGGREKGEREGERERERENQSLHMKGRDRVIKELNAGKHLLRSREGRRTNA